MNCVLGITFPAARMSSSAVTDEPSTHGLVVWESRTAST